MLTDAMRADGWIEHDGGRMPFGVKQDALVYLMWRDGFTRETPVRAAAVPWEHSRIGERMLHIIAYRPEKPHAD